MLCFILFTAAQYVIWSGCPNFLYSSAVLHQICSQSASEVVGGESGEIRSTSYGLRSTLLAQLMKDIFFWNILFHWKLYVVLLLRPLSVLEYTLGTSWILIYNLLYAQVKCSHRPSLTTTNRKCSTYTNYLSGFFPQPNLYLLYLVNDGFLKPLTFILVLRKERNV